MTIYLIISLLIAHVIGDFYLQTDNFCKKKEKEAFCGWNLYVHALILLALSLLASFQWSFLWAALAISLIHLVIDGIKGICENKIKINGKPLIESRYQIVSFSIDQILHIVVLIGVTLIWSKNNLWLGYSEFCNQYLKLLFVCLAVLVCWRPSNIFVRLILRFCEVKVGEISHDDSTKNNFHSGSLIGAIERWLIVAFVCLKQYEAIGFLIAAKSILRFSETKENEKSEYVLAGTLLSLCIAFICGITLYVIFHPEVLNKFANT